MSGRGNAAQLAPYQWKPGVSGNPAGRAAGRQKLESEFLRDLAESWATGGVDALNRAREKDPVAYVRVVASLMPKRLDPETIGNVSRAEVRALITTLQSLLFAGDAQDAGPGTSIPGQAERLPALSQAEGIPQSRCDVQRTDADGR